MKKNKEILTKEELKIQKDLENGLYKDIKDEKEVERYSKIFKKIQKERQKK